MSNVKVFPKAKAGRPPTEVPKGIDTDLIAVLARHVDPNDTDETRISAVVPGWLKDLIDKSSPRGVTMKGVILLGLRELGYPIDEDELNQLIDTGTLKSEDEI